MIHYREKFPVVVTAHGYTESTTLELSLRGDLDGGKKYENIRNITLKADRSQRIVFDLTKQEIGNYWLNAKTLNGKKYDQSMNLHYATKEYSVFVQTDKATYKPSDKVQFRVLILNSDTRPFKSNKTEIYISDGAQNRIKQFDSILFRKGVFKNELQLSDEPVLGTWSIHVKVNEGLETSQTFEVAKYVLPKFEVNIVTKPNVRTDEKIVVSCSAKYTYGKLITTGTAEITAESPYSDWIGNNIQKTTKTLPLIDGKATTEFDIAEELKLATFWYQQDVLITVKIKDSLSGQEQNATTTVTVHQNSYKIEFVSNDDNSFKPEIPFTITVIGKDLSDAPINDPKNPVSVDITYTYDTYEVETTTKQAEPEATTIPGFAVSGFWRPWFYPRFVQKVESVQKFFSNGELTLTLTATENVSSISVVVRILLKTYFINVSSFQSCAGKLSRKLGFVLEQFATN